MKLLIVLILLLVVPAAAAAPSPLGAWTGFTQSSSWIEQQQITETEPHNPFGNSCFWSVNDHQALQSLGYLDPGVSVIQTKCVVSDYPNVSPYGFATGFVQAKSASVTLSVCYQPQDRCFTAMPVYVPSERAYQSSFCVRAHYDQADPLMAPIAGSNGGSGLVTTVTTTITNMDDRRVRDVFARAGYASDIAVFLGWADAIGCQPTIPYVEHFDYPFEWTTS